MRSLTRAAAAVAGLFRTLAVAIATLGAGVLIAGQALGQECVDRDRVGAAIAEAGAFVRHEFIGADARAWLDLWDATPPATHSAGDHVVIVDRPSSPAVLVLALNGGCLVAAWPEGRGFVDRLADRVLGGRA